MGEASEWFRLAEPVGMARGGQVLHGSAGTTKAVRRLEGSRQALRDQSEDGYSPMETPYFGWRQTRR
jgi:hypothetical protein